MPIIKSITPRQILDSRGNPTVEVDLVLNSLSMGRAAVPSGASVGKYEAVELRDGGKAWHGQGVEKAVENIKNLSTKIIGKSFDQESLDQLLISEDGTENKSKLGANATLGISLSFAHSVAADRHQPLYEYIGELFGNSDYKLPRPMFNIMNGGKHALWATDVQEYMVIPSEKMSWSERLKCGAEIYQTLKNLLKSKELSTLLGDEGGFAPAVGSNQEALELLEEMIDQSGYQLEKEIQFSFDIASSEFFDEKNQYYHLKKDSRMLSSKEMIDWIKKFVEHYPVFSIEDGLSQDDWSGWTDLTAKIGNKYFLIGDDLLVTKTSRVNQAATQKACNGLLVKVNQAGTLSETLEAMKAAKKAGWISVMSHRSGETEDVTIAHLAVGTGCGFIKTGAPARSERTAKYNELTRIAERLERTTV